MDIRAYLESAERGSAAKIAAHVGVHPVMVSQWANGIKPVPPDRCPGVERATSGRVTVEELRPDVRWQRVIDADWPHLDGRPCIDVAAPEPAKAD